MSVSSMGRGGRTARLATPVAVLLWSLLAPSAARAQDMTAIFGEANAAYFAGDFERAAVGYQKLLDAGVDDASVHFNLATAHARRGGLGLAIFHFEHSLRLSPGDEAAEEGLSAARAALGSRRAERDGEATVQMRPPLSQALVRPFTERLLSWLLLILDVLLFATLTLRRLVVGEALRLGLGIAAPLLGMAMLLVGAAVVVKSGLLDTGDAAVVLRDAGQCGASSGAGR